MISIRRLFVLISLAYSAVMAAGFVAVHLWWLYPEKVQTVLQQQEAELASLEGQFKHLQDEVHILAKDHARQRDIIHFLTSEQPLPLSHLFNPDHFELLQLDGVIFLNRQQQALTLFQHTDFQHTDGLHPTPNTTPNTAARATQQANSDWADMPVTPDSGYTLFQGQPYISAAAPVFHQTSNEQLGHLILLRQIDQTMLDRIAETIGNPITLIPPRTDLMAFQDALTAPQTTLNLCQYLTSGKPAFCLTMMPRTAPPTFVHLEGVMTVILFSLLPLLVSIMALGLLIEPIRRVTRLLEQHHEARIITPIQVDSPLRILEFRQLEQAYNAVARTVEAQQQTLQDQNLELERQKTQLEQQTRELEKTSNTDRLTGIPNRRVFDMAVQQAWKRIQRRHYSIAVVMVDIDYFKQYNDILGHQQGDQALKQVAQALKRCSQRTDELVCRYGGEEFGLIIYIKDGKELEKYRQRLKDTITALQIPHPKSPLASHLTISAGISWIKEPGDWLRSYTPEYWVELADVALYLAKVMGRNTALHQTIAEGQDKNTHNSFEDLKLLKAQLEEQLRLQEQTETPATASLPDDLKQALLQTQTANDD